MAAAEKVYSVEDASEHAKSGPPAATFPGTLAGLATPSALPSIAPRQGRRSRSTIVKGKRRQTIRRFEYGKEG